MSILVENSDCFDYLKTLEDESVDCIIIDPPYGIFTATNFKDKKFDIESNFNQNDKDNLFKELYRVLKPDSWCAFFCQFKTDIEWRLSCSNAGFVERQEIIIGKKINPNPFNKSILQRHEKLMIYKKGNATFQDLTVSSTEEAIEGFENGFYNIEYINEVLRNYDTFLSTMFVATEKFTNKKVKLELELNNKINATYFLVNEAKTFKINSISLKKRGSRVLVRVLNKMQKTTSSLWFMTRSNRGFNEEFEKNHPTIKEVAILKKAIKLLTKENDVVLDCFLGSGSTALACIETNRRFIGCELDKGYYDISMKRIKEARKQNSFNFNN